MNTKFFVTVRPNLFNGKMFYAEPFIRKNFSKPEVFSKTVGLLYKNFRHCETNNFRRKMVTLLLCINIFDTRVFLKLWRDVNETFRHCETEKFWRQNVIPPILHKFFRLHQTFWNIEGLPTIFLALSELKFLTENCVIPNMHKLSHTTFFLTHCRDAHEDFRY